MSGVSVGTVPFRVGLGSRNSRDRELVEILKVKVEMEGYTEEKSMSARKKDRMASQ